MKSIEDVMTEHLENAGESPRKVLERRMQENLQQEVTDAELKNIANCMAKYAL